MSANSDLKLQEILMEDKGMGILADIGFRGNASKWHFVIAALF